MTRQVIRWPNDKLASAEAYRVWADDAFRLISGNPEDVFSYAPRLDAFDFYITPFLGPTGFDWNSQPCPEPEGGEAMRADGVLYDGPSVQWPGDDDD